MNELLSFQQSVTSAGWAVTDPVVDPGTVAERRARLHPMHCRVIHIKYAARPLATPLAWHRQVAWTRRRAFLERATSVTNKPPAETERSSQLARRRREMAFGPRRDLRAHRLRDGIL